MAIILFINHFKRKLVKQFGESIIITERNCKNWKSWHFRSMHTKNNKIKSQHGFNHAPSTSGSLRLLKSANDFITDDIYVMKTEQFSNIDPAGISSMEKHIKSVLESLQIVLRTLLSKNACVVKTSAVGQTIIQTARPRNVIAPLWLGLMSCFVIIAAHGLQSTHETQWHLQFIHWGSGICGKYRCLLGYRYSGWRFREVEWYFCIWLIILIITNLHWMKRTHSTE